MTKGKRVKSVKTWAVMLNGTSFLVGVGTLTGPICVAVYRKRQDARNYHGLLLKCGGLPMSVVRVEIKVLP